MIDVTNGNVRIEQDGAGAVIIIDNELDMAVLVLKHELPWVISTLSDIHRQITADARRVEDAATLDDWNALASMMAG